MKKYEHLHLLLLEWQKAVSPVVKPSAAISELIAFMESNPAPVQMAVKDDAPLPFKPGQTLREAVNDALLKARDQIPACSHDWLQAQFGRLCAKCHVYEKRVCPPLEPAIIGACCGAQGTPEQGS